jgi:hypothetical protein
VIRYAVLPANHQRILSVTARTVEETVDELEPLLRSRGIERLTTKVTVSFSQKKRETLLLKLDALRKANAELVNHFELTRSIVDEEQIVSAALVNLWTILIDSTAKGTKGYGQLEPDVAAELDLYVGRLLAIIDELT